MALFYEVQAVLGVSLAKLICQYHYNYVAYSCRELVGNVCETYPQATLCFILR